MSLSLYDATVPTFARMLTNLEAILDKAVAYAAEREIEPETLLTARLYPDMFDLTAQVQIATDFASRTVARLSGREPENVPFEKSTFEELKARIAAAQEKVAAANEADFAGAEEREIRLEIPSGELRFSGTDYVFNFVLPNFYFHLTTAYDILRHNGLAIGKMDFLGEL